MAFLYPDKTVEGLGDVAEVIEPRNAPQNTRALLHGQEAAAFTSCQRNLILD